MNTHLSELRGEQQGRAPIALSLSNWGRWGDVSEEGWEVGRPATWLQQEPETCLQCAFAQPAHYFCSVLR